MQVDTGSAHTDGMVSSEVVDVDLLESRDAAKSHLPHRDALILDEDTVRAGSNVLWVGDDRTHHQKTPKAHKVLDRDDGRIREEDIHKTPTSDHGNEEARVVHAWL